VALYFALQGDSTEDSVLWGIDLKWLEDRSNELLHQYHEDYPSSSDVNARRQYINRVILANDNAHPIIVATSPRQLNERMIAQQGELLCNLRHDVGFSSSLLGMLVRPSQVDRQVVSKVTLKRDRRLVFLKELRRMNIHEASLFPGLDGFARSLGDKLKISIAAQTEQRRQQMLENAKNYRRKKADAS
jgi:hypothetical protein